MRSVLHQLIATTAVLATLTCASAQDWDTVSLIRHCDYQAVNTDGSSAYAGGFPVRLRGVVLNNPETWLDPTPAYDPGVHLWQMGGEWEIFVQAIDSPNETYDDGDFGGIACWIGQNYGNHIKYQDPSFSYTDAEFLAELDRLNVHGDVVLRKGDLIEVRARGGLPYSGKMNVNEQHLTDPAADFDIVLLQQAYGLPTPTPLPLSAIKDASNVAIFDATRATGGERYECTLIELLDVTLVSTAGWSNGAPLQLSDGMGRTLDIELSRINFAQYAAPDDVFNLVGVVNQSSASGTDGYWLMALEPEYFTPALQLCADANCDGAVNAFDIDPFVTALVDATTYAASYPLCNRSTADANHDGEINAFDIDPFVAALVAGGCQ